MANAAKVFAVGDAILGDVEAVLKEKGLAYRKISLDDKLALFMQIAAERMAQNLGLRFSDLKPYITDYVGFGPSIYEHHHTMDVAKKASFLGLTGVELHSVDLGGASTPAALEIARKLCVDEERLVLIAGSEVPRGGDAGIKYYREVSDALLDSQRELHTQANLISLYALLADRLMFEHGISVSDIENITTYYRQQAFGNERAAMHGKKLKDGELKRYLAGPYATAMVAVATDHGVAILVANDSYLKNLEEKLGFSTAKKSLYINAVGTNYADKYLTRRKDFSSPGKKAAERAFARLAIKPLDIDYAWVYDCFTLMLVRQAADYFGLAPAEAAKTLAEGYIEPQGKKIPVNCQGGILNTQAAISLSASTGLIDIFDYAAEHPEAKHFLFGGNGGIDCVNSVAILSRESLEYRHTVLSPDPDPQLSAITITDGIKATLYAAATVKFNPGADTPFALGTFRDESHNLFLARICNADLTPHLDVTDLIRDKTRVTIRFVDQKPVAVLD